MTKDIKKEIENNQFNEHNAKILLDIILSSMTEQQLIDLQKKIAELKEEEKQKIDKQ